MLRIIADENIPYVQEALADLGTVQCLSGRDITRAHLAEADALLVRSITKVGPDLVGDTPVRFVGTATIGMDHVDTEYLAERGIAFTNCAGSNANSVVEYVLTALLVLAERKGLDLQGKTLGIVGVGNIGSRLEKKCRALGLEPICNDPPLAQQTGDKKYASLADALAADIVTCHVPLTRTGPYATYHLLAADELKRLRPDTILINSSRGPVVDNQALLEYLDGAGLGGVVLDVWENEPTPDAPLLDRTDIVSPHIAGYSLDGKVNGTIMLRHALCRLLGRELDMQTADLLPEPPVPHLTLDAMGLSEQAVLHQAMTAIYDIQRDDRDMRPINGLPANQRGPFFDQLRKNYPVRREAANTRVSLSNASSVLQKKLSLLGFAVG